MFAILGVNKLQIIKLKIEDIKPYENNTKIHTVEQIEQIKESINRFGNNDPIGIWSEDNIIVEGHGRFLALQELGYEEIDCIRLDHLTNEERKAYAIAHNKINMNTDFDIEALKLDMAELNDLEDFDLLITGFNQFELDSVLNPITDDDISNFFVEKEVKDKKPKMIKCPLCNGEFEH